MSFIPAHMIIINVFSTKAATYIVTFSHCSEIASLGLRIDDARLV